MADIGVPGERFAFDQDVWAEEVERFDARGKARAEAVRARRDLARPGARIPARACDPDARDGTRLERCAKVYVPIGVEPSRAPYGFVFAIRADAAGRVWLRFVAYG